MVQPRQSEIVLVGMRHILTEKWLVVRKARLLVVDKEAGTKAFLLEAEAATVASNLIASHVL